jgi:SH3-like domain-containing protein
MRIDSRILRCAAAIFCLFAATAMAGEPPHYASVRKDKAYLRQGPSYANRILWIYQHKDYPLLVTGSFDAWRRVKDKDGTVGWMHHTQLSDRRTVVFIGFTKSPLRDEAGPNAKILAYAQPGVVARLKACQLRFCEVDASGTSGWVDKRDIWGVDRGEVFQ